MKKDIHFRIRLINELLKKRIQILQRRGDTVGEDYQVIELAQRKYQLKQSLSKTTKEG